MTNGYKALIVALAALMLGAGTAGAQASCSISTDSPGDLKNASNDLLKLEVGIGRNDQRKVLQDVVKKLTEKPAKFESNPLGRDLVLGRALADFAAMTDQPPVAQRGTLGFTTEPQATIDIVATADSLFDLVEQQQGCADETTPARQRVWQPLVNRAGQLLNADQLDSAEVLLRRANVIYDGLPYAEYYLAGIAQRRNDDSAAIAHFAEALKHATKEQAAKDSNVAQIRATALYSLAISRVQAAQQDSGAARQEEMKEALKALQEFLAEFPQSEYTARAKGILPSLLAATGDTAAVTSMWQRMADEPAEYSDMQLFQAGTDAFEINKQLAARLLEAGLKKNPYYRPALYNAVNTYYVARDFDKMKEYGERLVNVDPNSSDNLQLLAVAYDQLSQKAGPGAKKALHDSAAALVDRADALPAVVDVSEFDHDGQAVVLAGAVENKKKQAQEVTLRIDFLDNTGQVVTHRDETVALPASGSKAFTIRVDDGQQIAAYRFAPLTS